MGDDRITLNINPSPRIKSLRTERYPRTTSVVCWRALMKRIDESVANRFIKSAPLLSSSLSSSSDIVFDPHTHTHTKQSDSLAIGQ